MTALCQAPAATGSGAFAFIKGNGLMLVDARRTLYRGLLVSTSTRCLGGFVAYMSLHAPFEISIESGPWRMVRSAVLVPYREHAVRAGRLPLAQVMWEQDDVHAADLPEWLQRDAIDPLNPDDLVALQRRLLSLSACRSDEVSRVIDDAVMGRTLRARSLDPRVRRVLDRIDAEPGEPHSAQDCAALVGLSVSRFLHLFTAEVGVPFRRLRAWKRARSMLKLMEDGDNLTGVALSAGYASSSHFSNSIRDAYGLKPRDIVAGRRHLDVVCRGAAGRAGAC